MHDLSEKKDSVLNTLNKLENTCGLDTVGFKRELSELALETLTTHEELSQAESKLNLIINRVNALSGKCSDIKSQKDYIEENWPAVVSILDSSDASLRNNYGTLKYQHVTEGNLKERAEEYTTIASRVKAIIDSNNEILKLTSNISKAIEENENAEWFDTSYYENWKKRTKNVPKTEEALLGKKKELDKLFETLNANLNEEAIQVISELNDSKTMKYFALKERSSDDKDDWYEQYEAIVKPIIAENNKIIAKAKVNHSLNGVADKLKALLATINRVDKLVAKIQEVNEIVDLDKDLLDKSYYRSLLKEVTISKDSLDLHEANVEKVLAELKSIVSKVDDCLFEIELGAIAKGRCEHTGKWPLGKTLSSAGCTILSGKVAEEVKRLREKFKKDHDIDALIKGLKKLCNNSQSYIDDATYLEFDLNEVEKESKKLEKLGIDVAAARENRYKLKEYTLDNLPTKRADVKKLLTDMRALDKALNKIKSSEFAKYFAQGKCLVGDKCGIHDRYADVFESLVKNDFKDVEKVLNNINETEKTSAKINSKIKQLSAYSWFDKKHYEERLNEIEVAPKNKEELRVLTDRRAGLLSHLDSNYSAQYLKKRSSLDTKIKALISKFGEYNKGLKTDAQKIYDEKIEELKKIHDAGEVVAELEKHKNDLQTTFEKLEKACKDTPDKCKEQQKGE